MSASEYLRCAPKYTISRLIASPHPTPSAPSEPLALVPPLKNPGYAPDNSSEEFQRQQRVFANVSRTATDRTVVRRTNRPMRRSLQRLVDGEQVYKRLSLGRTRRQQAKRRRTGGDMHAIRGHWHHWIDRIRVPIRLPL